MYLQTLSYICCNVSQNHRNDAKPLNTYINPMWLSPGAVASPPPFWLLYIIEACVQVLRCFAWFCWFCMMVQHISANMFFDSLFYIKTFDQICNTSSVILDSKVMWSFPSPHTPGVMVSRYKFLVTRMAANSGNEVAQRSFNHSPVKQVHNWKINSHMTKLWTYDNI